MSSVTNEDGAVGAYVAAVVEGATVTDVRRFTSGERHRVYRVAYVGDDGRDGAVVVRVSLGASAAGRAQATHEASVLKLVGGIAGPRLLDVRLDESPFAAPVMCLEHVDGEERDLAVVPTEDLAALGSLVGRVHSLPTGSLGTAPTDAVSYARAYASGIVERLVAVEDALPPPFVDEVRRARLDAEGRAASVADSPGFGAGPIVLLHADLSSTNVLWRPAPVLIDWEYAWIGDAADEVGYVFGQHALGPAQRDAFWRGYRLVRPPDAGMAERVAWWEPMVLLGSATWWFERWAERTAAEAGGVADASVPKEPAYYLDQALRRLRRSWALVGG